MTPFLANEGISDRASFQQAINTVGRKKFNIVLPVASDPQKRDLLSAHARMLIKAHC